MAHACNCIGPQNGEPKCPCMMRNVVQRDGRWVQTEVDLGPVRPNVRATGWSQGIQGIAGKLYDANH